MPPKEEPSITIKISSASFHEVVDALAKEGYKMGENADRITLVKGTKITQPIDFRLANIRKDAALIAARVYQQTPTVHFVKFTNEVYDYIVNGLAKEWK